jgi:predicted metal-dependent phosphoesterase TrpH
MKDFKGIIHVHSNYSYDGKHSIDEIAAFARQRSYAFVGMSEHSDTLDSDKVKRMRDECRRASTPDCLIIPGIEFTCLGNLHLIGLGVQDYDSSKDPLFINDFIQEQGGVAIIAHPKRYHYQISQVLLTAVNGVEIWNAGYDGRFVPNDHSITLLKRARERHESLLAFGGQDLHTINHKQAEVSLSVCCERLVPGLILDAIRDGNFVISNGYVSVGAQERLDCLKALSIYLGNRLYSPVKNLRERFV